MIVKMKKIHVVVHQNDHDKLLDALRDLGVLHIEPVDPDRAVAEEKITADLGRIQRAMQILASVEPAGDKPDLTAADAVDEIMDIQRRQLERENRLASLHRQLEHQSMWNDLRVDDYKTLKDAGVEIQFFAMPADLVTQTKAEFLTDLGELPSKQHLIAVIDRKGDATIPEKAQPLHVPHKDNDHVRAEAQDIAQKCKKATTRLAQLAQLHPQLTHHQQELQDQAEFSKASRGALTQDTLFAIQGWLPTDEAPKLTENLRNAGIQAALRTFEAAEDEHPPTLVRYPKWAQPIQGLFNILGTVAGYREFDVSPPFMIALPVFAALLIGDGGYGAFLLLALLLTYKKSSKALGPDFTNLLIIVGAVSLVWGFICASFFGFILYKPLIPVNMTDQSRALMMNISFVMGAIHLSVAQLWQAIRLAPDLRALNRLGWAIFVWGMLGVVRMFVLNAQLGWNTPWPYALIIGGSLAVIFASPSRNPIKMIALGLADFPLSMLSAFSDVISYVRLMAVGLASGVLASSFNELALGSGSWFIAVPTLIFGHGLNLGLAMIALFAHGVRLNMLEFSNNLGMQWTGYAYQPFVKRVS